ncbi:MAG: hypothetical protein QOF60_3093 [Actinomycetota bacterium]|nr:hypothetical protein [Actinomycetota bacterium]
MPPRQSPRLVPTGDIRSLIELGIRLQEVATEHALHNVFDDGGYKELLLLRLFNLRKLYREGDDAEDEQGRRYEVKTVARISSRGLRKPQLDVTTEHTLTRANIARYRQVFLWIVAVFDQSHPEAIYEIMPEPLEVYFSKWEAELLRQEKLRTTGGAPVHLNNPKIPLNFVKRYGLQVWPPRDAPLPEAVQQALELSERLDDV